MPNNKQKVGEEIPEIFFKPQQIVKISLFYI